jgi:hypothetical protein
MEPDMAPLMAVSLTGDGAHLVILVGVCILVVLALFGVWRR